MPRPNKKQKAIRNRLRRVDGCIQSAEVVLPEWETVELNHDQLVEQADVVRAEASCLDLISDSNTEISKRPLTYTSTSRTTKWRKNAEAAKVDPAQTLQRFGFTVAKSVETQQLTKFIPHTEKEIEGIKSIMPAVKALIAPVMSKKKDDNARASYNNARYLSVYEYCLNRLGGKKKGLASEEAAEKFWPQNSKEYCGMTIIKWTKEFIDEGKLSDHSQVAHVKRVSLLSDSDVKMAVLEEIRKMKPALRSLIIIKKIIDEQIIPSVLGVVESDLSMTTIARYLYEWGYSYRKNKKTIFFDGHEREDVITYRNEWSKRMVEYMKRSEFYAGNNEEEVLEPILDEGMKQIVFVTHDESTFYANDGKDDLWLLEGENHIRKKGPGSSIMVSEFQCPCHGTMKSAGWTSRRFFKAGVGREGYWKYTDMLEQLQDDAIPLFELLHPGCQAVFLFDNSSNHNAFGDDALVASRVTLNEKPYKDTEKFQFKDTTVVLTDGTRLEQSFFYTKTTSVTNRLGYVVKTKETRFFKGIRKILEERGQWLGHDLEGKAWKMLCKSKEPGHRSMCCCGDPPTDVINHTIKQY
ncbi:hypothetical protein INT47_011606 [Mucor saturninus]|uniref:DDE-1 domain-containing protein n=1 Tax=Mucor saturninus TaxID=64648 RepID=A0A8H7R4K5_9FUNG|nr:hypothetical protein INT47_011606 [Mucor saturninus]